MELFFRLGLSLAIGLLIGLERGWQQREGPEGSRVAGIRTYGLIGLLGGIWALLAEELGEILLGFAFAAFVALMIVAHLRARTDTDQSVTGVVASLVTFALGALAVRGHEAVAPAAGVVTAVLLSMKPVLHSWLRRIEPAELYAGLKLLLISVVLLPVLPDRGFGPWAALNPYELWWMVVLIAGISFVGYLAMKIAGTQRGVMLTGLFGGMVSSTAVTLSFSRMGSTRTTLRRLLAAGILAAAGTMFPRMLVEIAVVNRNLLGSVALPLGVMTAASACAAAWLWRMERSRHAAQGTEEVMLRNPMELWPAVQFGLLLSVVILLAQLLRAWLGEAGIYLLAGISGIADVDAITLSLSRMAQTDLVPQVAARGIVLAATVNTLVKGVLALAIGGRAMGVPIFLGLLITAALGVVASLAV
jgi:uncharacterized membrane protein (DUF4010 family)